MVYFYVVQSIVSIALVISYFLLVRYTFFLKKATEKYAETTKGLLEQSKQTVEQSRLLAEVTKELLNQSKIVFRSDLVGKFLEYIDQLRKITASADAIATSCKVRLLVLGRANKPLAEELWEDLKNVGEDLRIAMEKHDASFREKLDKRVKK